MQRLRSLCIISICSAVLLSCTIMHTADFSYDFPPKDALGNSIGYSGVYTPLVPRHTTNFIKKKNAMCCGLVTSVIGSLFGCAAGIVAGGVIAIANHDQLGRIPIENILVAPFAILIPIGALTGATLSYLETQKWHCCPSYYENFCETDEE